MSIRTNTLGKSAIINRQLNGAYDIVEYVADNLPLLVEAANKITLIANIDYVKDHVDNPTPHVSEEDRANLNKLATLDYISSKELSEASTKLNTFITNISTGLQEHLNNEDIHVSEEDRELLRDLQTKVENITNSLNTLEGSKISYRDLLDLPSIDTSLDINSTNTVENRAITEAINSMVTRRELAKVSITGKYTDLKDTPIVDTELDPSSNNAISNKVVTKIINNFMEGVSRSLSYAEIDEVLNGK